MEIALQILNATSNLPQTEPPIVNLAYATWAIAFATIAVGYFTIRYSQKQNQRNAIIDIFKMINNETHKSSEALIIDRFRENALYNVNTLHFEPDANIIMRNYDQLGLLTSRKGLIPDPEDIFNMFGKLVIVTHVALFQHIRNRRLNGETDYMVNFTRLAIKSYDYWERVGKERLPRNPQGNMPITRDNVKFWEESLPK